MQNHQVKAAKVAVLALVVLTVAPLLKGNPACASHYSGCAHVHGNTTADTTNEVEEVVNSEAAPPELGVLGPNVNLSNIQIITTAGGGKIVDIPWIADLITQLFKWSVGAAAVVAATMIMLGGFQYLTAGSDSGRVSAGKTRMVDATIGLLLVVFAYLILGTFNQELLSFHSIKLKSVETDRFEGSLGSTLEDTTGRGLSGSGPMRGGDWSPSLSGCPVTVTTPDTGTERSSGLREREMFDALRTWVATQSSDPGRRVVLAAEAVTKCETRFGSCGTNAGTITAIAGFGGKRTSCFTSPTGRGNSCNGNRGPAIWELGYPSKTMLYGQRCDAVCQTNPVGYHVSHGYGDGWYPRADCVTNGTTARIRVLNYLRQQAAAGALGVENYPDEILDQLRPGDYINYYNGNKDLTGSHALIFLGWASNGWAQVISASWGGFARPHTACLRASCGDRMQPIIGAWHPS